MRFSCERCSQRYFSVDEPAPGQRYNIPCVVCNGSLLLEGGDFPALPTVAADPTASPGQAAISDATGKEPLSVALAPPDVQEPPAVPVKPQPQRAELPRAATVRRRPRTAPAVGVILATAGSGILLFAGAQRLLGQGDSPLARQYDERPEPSRARAASRTTEAARSTLSPTPWAKGRAAAAPSASPAPAPEVQEAIPSSPRSGPPAPREGPPGAPEPARAIVVEPSAVSGSSPPQQAQLGSASPTPERVAAALAAKRPELDACLKGGPRLQGRRRSFHLVLTVNSSGIVTQTKIDDPFIQATAAGECVRGAVSGLVFSMFRGEPVTVRVRLTVGGE